VSYDSLIISDDNSIGSIREDNVTPYLTAALTMTTAYKTIIEKYIKNKNTYN